jgi:hypothetical protein
MIRQLTFKDLQVNSSVKAGDEDRLAGQAAAIGRLFEARQRDGLLVSTLDLMGIFDDGSGWNKAQYQARLYEFRRFLIPRGSCIDRLRKAELPAELAANRRKGVNYYKLRPLADSTFFAERKHRPDIVKLLQGEVKE